MRQFLIPFVIVASLTFLATHFYKNNDLYGYDEADYKFAAEKGIAANYLDKNALPLRTFFESGANLGRDKSKRTELSEMVRSSGDISFYRHYHGPLFSYWLNILGFLGSESEESTRAGTLVLLGFTALILFWATNRIHRISLICAMLPVVLLFGSQINILTSAGLTPHAIYCLTSVSALALLSKFLITNKLRDWYLALIMLSFVVISIEYAVLVAATFVICLYIYRKTIFGANPILPFALRSMSTVMFTTAVLWLGGIMKLTLVKNYVFFAYFTLVRGSEYGTGNFFTVWVQRFEDSPVICALSLATIIYFFVTIKRHRVFIPYLAYPLLIIITSFRNTSPSPTYVSSIFPPIFLLAGIALFEICKGRNRAFPVLLTILTAVLCIASLRPLIMNSKESEGNILTKEIVAYIQARPQSDSSIIAPRIYLPTLHYYCRDKHFSGYAEEFDDQAMIETILSRRALNGFLYVGNYPGRYLHVLQEHYKLSPDTLRQNSGRMTSAIYYRLQAL